MLQLIESVNSQRHYLLVGVIVLSGVGAWLVHEGLHQQKAKGSAFSISSPSSSRGSPVDKLRPRKVDGGSGDVPTSSVNVTKDLGQVWSQIEEDYEKPERILKLVDYIQEHSANLDMDEVLKFVTETFGPGRSRRFLMNVSFYRIPGSENDVAASYSTLDPVDRTGAMEGISLRARRDFFHLTTISRKNLESFSIGERKQLLKAAGGSLVSLLGNGKRSYDPYFKSSEFKEKFFSHFTRNLEGIDHLFPQGSPDEISDAYLTYFESASHMKDPILFDLVSSPEIEMTKEDRNGYRENLIVRQVSQGADPEVLVETLRQNDLPISNLFTEWMKKDSHEPIAWLQSHPNILDVNRDEAIVAIVDFSIQKGEVDTAKAWVENLVSADVRERLNKSISVAEQQNGGE